MAFLIIASLPVLKYMTLQNYFSHPSLVIYFFATPPIKTETGTAHSWELLYIANHLDQSLCLTNQKQGTAVKSYLLHSSLAGVQLCCAFYGLSKLRGHTQERNHFPTPFTSLSKLRSYAGEKPFSGAKPAYFSFASFDFDFKVQGVHTEHRWGCFPPTSTPSFFFPLHIWKHILFVMLRSPKPWCLSLQTWYCWKAFWWVGVHQGGFVMFTPMVQSSLGKKKNTKNLTKVFYRKNGESWGEKKSWNC